MPSSFSGHWCGGRKDVGLFDIFLAYKHENKNFKSRK